MTMEIDPFKIWALFSSVTVDPADPGTGIFMFLPYMYDLHDVSVDSILVL